MELRQVLRRRRPSSPEVGSTVGHRRPDLPPQDGVRIDERRHREEDDVHRGHW